MLYLVRHGRTELNAQRRLQGRLDPPLDIVGERQAQAVAARLVELTIGSGGVHRVVASPLLRAQQTASYVADDVDTDPRWIELHYGDLEGATLDEVPPTVWEGWYNDPSFAAGGGESFGSVTERVGEALADLVDQARVDNVVVVAHVTPIKAAVAQVLEAGYQALFRCHLSHAALTTVGFGRYGPVLQRFNEVVEIDPEPADPEPVDPKPAGPEPVDPAG